jgi:hypothetical protein
MRRLASFARVIVFDKRGSGLSDPVGAAATVEERIDDIRAVMDAAPAPSARTWSAGRTARAWPLCSGPAFPSGYRRSASTDRLRAALRPRATLGALAGGMGPDPPGGRGRVLGPGFEPADARAQRVRRRGAGVRWGRFERQSMTPTMARTALRLCMEFDIRDVVSTIRVATLVVQRRDGVPMVEGARWIAAQIPDARLVELLAMSTGPWITDPEEIVDGVEELPHRPAPRARARPALGDRVTVARARAEWLRRHRRGRARTHTDAGCAGGRCAGTRRCRRRRQQWSRQSPSPAAPAGATAASP